MTSCWLGRRGVSGGDGGCGDDGGGARESRDDDGEPRCLRSTGPAVGFCPPPLSELCLSSQLLSCLHSSQLT